MQKPIESEIEGDVDKWQSVRILEQLKRVIVQQTSLASTIFTVVRLICNTLLCESISSSYDYSSASTGNVVYRTFRCWIFQGCDLGSYYFECLLGVLKPYVQ